MRFLLYRMAVPDFVPLLPEHNYGRVHHHDFRATVKSKREGSVSQEWKRSTEYDFKELLL